MELALIGMGLAAMCGLILAALWLYVRGERCANCGEGQQYTAEGLCKPCAGTWAD